MRVHESRSITNKRLMEQQNGRQNDFSRFLRIPAFPALDSDKMVLKMGKEPGPGATWLLSARPEPVCLGCCRGRTLITWLGQTGLRSIAVLSGADGGRGEGQAVRLCLSLTAGLSAPLPAWSSRGWLFSCLACRCTTALKKLLTFFI